MLKHGVGTPPLVGVIAGMESELSALGALRGDPRIATAVSGARPDQAEREARRLAALGCRLLISWGVAGGLHPGLTPGTLIVGTDVVEENGMRHVLVVPPIPGLRRVRLMGLDRPAMTARDKAALHAASGADAVDMESHRIARAGEAANLPVMAIRAVGDPAARALPRLAADALGVDGRPRIARVVLGLLTEPWALPALIRLKSDTDAALAALAAIATRLPGLAAKP
ncbi:adenosylhopane nucleosidase [Limibaculum sp. M0105]|uniref:Adenosylhopane nucleosidase n=1 Tax=Thermohalobaculum xanthum TaxID=2753746 RepID=A0A8J7M3P7_9RHOB|nr:adenosylhopane nucleosidase [Thermohalobaculum xanthum]MBK0397735.1 adenosylhopane nucleosidase [Thermohalobaculum xanthum]